MGVDDGGRWLIVRTLNEGYQVTEQEPWDPLPPGTVGRYRRKAEADVALAELPSPADARQPPLFPEGDW